MNEIRADVSFGQTISADVGIQGPRGPIGSVGPMGPQGVPGPQGEGLALKGISDFADLPTTGNEAGDAYATTDGNLYVWTGVMWVDAGSFQGPQGEDGAAGAQGPQGIQGPQGERGVDGLQGVDGIDGPVGAQGPAGPTGPIGPQGIQGIQGERGLQGVQGEIGPRGEAGANGIQGPQGTAGATGPIGPAGATGPQGEKGNTGAGVTLRGSKATVAALPASGNTIGDGFIVDEDGDLYVWNGTSWDDIGQIVGPTGPAGATGPAGSTGAEGPQGIQGVDGPTGATGPQGPIGLTGPQGAAGTNGSDGAVGPEGPAGSAGATGAQGPIGPQGDVGPQGPQGIQGIQGTTGSTGAAGPGIPAGGVQGQRLQKASGVDYATAWVYVEKPQVGSTAAGTSTASIVWSSYEVIRLTLATPTVALTMSGAQDGQRCLLEVIQDGTGGRLLTFGSEVRFGTDITSITLSTAPNKTDRIGLIYNSAAGKFDVVAVVKGF